jgi:hypothetical protein
MMKNTRILPAIGLALLAALLITTLALAAVGSIQRGLVSAGGGQFSAGSLTLQSASGQPVAGVVSNGVILCSGLHCGAGALSSSHDLYLPMIVR